MTRACHQDLRRCAARELQTAAERGNGVGPTGGPSDDIGDISWIVPTVTLRYPSNIPGGPGHNWANGDLHGDAHRAQGCQSPARKCRP